MFKDSFSNESIWIGMGKFLYCFVLGENDKLRLFYGIGLSTITWRGRTIQITVSYKFYLKTGIEASFARGRVKRGHYAQQRSN